MEGMFKETKIELLEKVLKSQNITYKGGYNGFRLEELFIGEYQINHGSLWSSTNNKWIIMTKCVTSHEVLVPYKNEYTGRIQYKSEIQQRNNYQLLKQVSSIREVLQTIN